MQAMATSVLALAHSRRSSGQLKIKMALAVLFILLNLADAWTTNHALAQGAGVEGNPFMAHVQATAGVWWPLPKMMLAIALAWIWARIPVPFTTTALGLLCAVMGGIVWHNWSLIA
jgi:hypothetical protein